MRCWPAIILVCIVRSGLYAQLPVGPAPSAGPALLFTTRHFTAANGLPHRVVSAIAQDQRGFLWLGTPQGLARFDGHGFMSLTSGDGLASDAVRAVVCDPKGMLWVNYVNGMLDLLDPITLDVMPLRAYLEHVPEEAVGMVSDITSLEDGTIVFVRNRELFWYTGEGSTLGRAKVMCSGWVDQLRRDAGGQVWCSCHVKPGVEWPVQLVRTDLAVNDRNASPRETFRSPDTIAYVTRAGLDLFHRKPDVAQGSYLLMKSERYMRNVWLPSHARSIPEPAIRTEEVSAIDTRNIFRTRLTDDLWLVGMRILSMTAGEDPLASPVLYDLAKYFLHTELGQLDVLRDRTGNLWIGGEFGLFRITLRPDRFNRFLWNGSTQLVGDHRIRGLFVQGDRLHVNTESSGYRVLHAQQGTVLHQEEDGRFRGGIISDGRDGFWRTFLGGMVHHDANGEMDRSLSAVGDFTLWTGLALKDGSTLLGLTRGLRMAGPAGDRSVLVKTGSAELDQAWVAHLSHTHDDRILVCSSAGLFLLDGKGSMLERWWSGAGSKDTHHLPTDDIRFAFADSAGVYWLATGSKGLLRWDRSKGVLQAVGRAYGFPTASIHAILPDRLGNLWMSTDRGLVRYHPHTGHVKVYTTADGLGFDEFNRLAYALGPDGRMYFGGLNGITAFHPDELLEPDAAALPPLVLKSMKIQREVDDHLQELLPQVLKGATARMHPKDRFMTVELALLTYEDPELLTYAWRIDGIDVDWNLQREPSLRFTTLPYGQHLLRIKAQNAAGNWSNELHVPIGREAPLHLRWWFIALCVLALAGIVYAIVRYREQQLRRMIRMRDRIATDLHDEVGSNLSSIVLFSTAVSKHTDTLPEYASGMLQRMKENSKRAMESMNDIVWSVNSGHDSMEDLVDRMRAYAEPLCEAAGINVEFDVDAGPPTRKLAMEQRKNLYLIFKEAVSNAVRHGRCARITVTLRMVHGQIELVVEDDGIGLPDETARGGSLGGNGLGNMARRATEIGGSVQVMVGEPSGTRVLFCFVPREE